MFGVLDVLFGVLGVLFGVLHLDFGMVHLISKKNVQIFVLFSSKLS